jgi:hypothetical protein
MRRGSQNNCSSTKSAHRDTNSLYVKTSQLERKIIGRSHPNLVPLLSNGDTTCSSCTSRCRGILYSTRESHKWRRKGILDATTRFGAQELGIRAILLMRRGVDGFSPSSWEPQEESMMSTAASFSLSKKPRFVSPGKIQYSRRWCWLAY